MIREVKFWNSLQKKSRKVTTFKVEFGQFMKGTIWHGFMYYRGLDSMSDSLQSYSPLKKVNEAICEQDKGRQI